MLMLKAIITVYLALNPTQGNQAFELHTSVFRDTIQCPIKNIPNFSCSQKTYEHLDPFMCSIMAVLYVFALVQ